MGSAATQGGVGIMETAPVRCGGDNSHTLALEPSPVNCQVLPPCPHGNGSYPPNAGRRRGLGKMGVDRDRTGRSPGHCCILGSCVGSAYMEGQPWSGAWGLSSKCQGSLP